MDQNSDKNYTVLYWTIIGLIASCFIFAIVYNFISKRDIAGAIFAGTVTISVIICYCTGRLIESMNTQR